MMSKWIIAIGLILVMLVAAALLARKAVRAELFIEADPDQVWAVLTDPDSYEDWNPILISVDGEFIEGQTLSVGMKNRDGSVTTVEPTIRKLLPGRELNQVGGVPGILTFNHTWKLEAVNGGTRVTQFEEYRGIGVLFWNPEWVERSYRQANLSLRDWIGARTSSTAWFSPKRALLADRRNLAVTNRQIDVRRRVQLPVPGASVG